MNQLFTLRKFKWFLSVLPKKLAISVNIIRPSWLWLSPGQGLKLYLAYDGFDGGHRFILPQVKPAHMSVFRDFGLIFSERFGPYHSSNFWYWTPNPSSYIWITWLCGHKCKDYWYYKIYIMLLFWSNCSFSQAERLAL